MQVNLPLYYDGERDDHGCKFALAAPGTTNYIFSEGTTPSAFRPHEKVVTVRVTVCLAVSGTFSVGMNDGSTTKAMLLNGGTALAAGALYTFSFEARRDHTYDFKLGTDGIVNLLAVSEVGGGIT